MNAESLFRSVWQNTPALQEILSVTRISTGMSPGKILPFMVLLETHSGSRKPTNMGMRQHVSTMKITYHAPTRDALTRLADALETYFSGILHAVTPNPERGDTTQFTARRVSDKRTCVHHDHWLLETEMELTINAR